MTWVEIGREAFTDQLLNREPPVRFCAGGDLAGGGSYREWSPDGRQETAILRTETRHGVRQFFEWGQGEEEGNYY